MNYNGVCYISFKDKRSTCTYGFEVKITDRDIDDGVIEILHDHNWFDNSDNLYLCLSPDIEDDIKGGMFMFHDLYECTMKSDNTFSLGFVLENDDKSYAKLAINTLRDLMLEHFDTKSIGDVRFFNEDIHMAPDRRVLELLTFGKPL